MQFTSFKTVAAALAVAALVAGGMWSFSRSRQATREGAEVSEGAAHVAARTLIVVEGGSYKPALAKAWHRSASGAYEFELDPTREITKGVTVSPEHVKESLEAKLGKSELRVRVTASGPSSVTVAFRGDDGAFLMALARAKIRDTSAQLSLSSSVLECEPVDKEPYKSQCPAAVKSYRERVKALGLAEDKVSYPCKTDADCAVVLFPFEQCRNVVDRKTATAVEALRRELTASGRVELLRGCFPRCALVSCVPIDRARCGKARECVPAS